MEKINPFDEFNLPKIPGLLEINCSPLEEFVKHYFLSEELKDLPLETKKNLVVYGTFSSMNDDVKNKKEISLSKGQLINYQENLIFMDSPNMEEKVKLYIKTGDAKYLKKGEPLILKLFFKAMKYQSE